LVESFSKAAIKTFPKGMPFTVFSHLFSYSRLSIIYNKVMQCYDFEREPENYEKIPVYNPTGPCLLIKVSNENNWKRIIKCETKRIDLNSNNAYDERCSAPELVEFSIKRQISRQTDYIKELSNYIPKVLAQESLQFVFQKLV
jgi:hypothetical protein